VPSEVGEPQDLRGPILLTAFILLAIDALVVFWLSGELAASCWRRPAAATLLLVGVFLARFWHSHAPHAHRSTAKSSRADANRTKDQANQLRSRQSAADQNPDFAMKATLETRLPLCSPEDSEVDAISRRACRASPFFFGSALRSKPGADRRRHFA
jgi:hypothetical protein